MTHPNAFDDNGAVEVEEAPLEHPPLIVTLIGPIRVWWSEWGSQRHQTYTAWRDAVRVALIKAGCLVYSPHRAIQGRWHPRAQAINNTAIEKSDVVVVLTPPGCPADGTAEEIQVAMKAGVPLVAAPPSDDAGLAQAVAAVTAQRTVAA